MLSSENGSKITPFQYIKHCKVKTLLFPLIVTVKHLQDAFIQQRIQTG